MFESFEKRRVPRSRAIAPIVVVLAAAAVVLVVRDRRSGQREDEVRRAELDVPPSGSGPGPGPTATARLELPGMSIEAPGIAPITGDYVTGGVQHETAPEWGVTWQQGKLPPPDVLDRIVGAMTRALEARLRSTARVAGSRELTVAGAPGRRYDLTDDRGYTFVVTFTTCGGRVIQILTGGPAGARERERADAMTGSFRCTPDPEKDPGQEAVAVEVRPGWRRTAAGKALLVDDREVLVRPTLLPGAGDAPLEAFVPVAARAAGFAIDADRPQLLGERALWRGSVDGHPAAILAWRCPGEHRVAAVYVISTKDAPLDAGIELARTGRCLAPGEAPPDYPVRGR